jgi:hypothetical protein
VFPEFAIFRDTRCLSSLLCFFRTQSSYKDNNKTFPYAMQRRELGLAGVTQYGSALQHAAAELRGDREFVLVAVK